VLHLVPLHRRLLTNIAKLKKLSKDYQLMNFKALVSRLAPEEALGTIALLIASICSPQNCYQIFQKILQQGLSAMNHVIHGVLTYKFKLYKQTLN